MSKMHLSPKIKMSDGNEIPLIGLGTWKSKPGQVYEAVKAAIQCGYRHIDCALAYQNETEVGKAIKEKIADKTIKREDLFVTSKAWNTYHSREKVIEGCKKTLKDLQLDYLDLYLVHWPMAYKEGGDIFPTDENGKILTKNVDITETWKGMEDCKEKGLVKSIGLSNFNSQQIKKILDTCKIKPVMNQIECHPYLNQHKLIEFCKSVNIAVTAYSPLGSPDRPWHETDKLPTLMEDERILNLAKKYNKSPAQILLRYNAQRGVVVIPKSVTEERIINNFKIFDFELTEEEMKLLGSFKENYRYCQMNGLKDHPDYPFNVEY